MPRGGGGGAVGGFRAQGQGTVAHFGSSPVGCGPPVGVRGGGVAGGGGGGRVRVAFNIRIPLRGANRAYAECFAHFLMLPGSFV